jgi:hypothetical protein
MLSAKLQTPELSRAEGSPECVFCIGLCTSEATGMVELLRHSTSLIPAFSLEREKERKKKEKDPEG